MISLKLLKNADMSQTHEMFCNALVAINCYVRNLIYTTDV